MKHISILQNIAIAAALGVTSTIALKADPNFFDHCPSHFENMDDEGHLVYSVPLGTLKIDKDNSLPLLFTFNSANSGASPYLGAGWTFPLFESKMYLTEDNHFKLVTPEGETLMFWRPHPQDASDNSLVGPDGWKASINGDEITIVTPSNWTYVYLNGSLDSIQCPNGSLLQFVRGGSTVSAIMLNDQPLISTTIDQSSGRISGLQLGDRQIQFDLGRRPVVQAVDGKNIVAEVDQALSKLAMDGHEFQFSYGVNSSLQPSVKLITPWGRTGNSVTWDPATSKVISDSNWNYDDSFVKDGIGGIQRTSSSTGNAEYICLSPNEILYKGADGNEKALNRFVNGPLKGKLRSVSVMEPSGQRSEYDAFYDEQGRIIRAKCVVGDSAPNVLTYAYKDDQTGHNTTLFINGVRESETRDDNNGRCTVTEDGTLNGFKQYSYVTP